MGFREYIVSGPDPVNVAVFLEVETLCPRILPRTRNCADRGPFFGGCSGGGGGRGRGDVHFAELRYGQPHL